MYDYNTDNNTATITAAAGTGGGEGAPPLRGANDPGPSITVTWEAIETVNGVPVSHYQVERSASPWEMIADNVVGTTYVDTTAQPGRTYQYRVRAENEAEVPGPWSGSHGGNGEVSQQWRRWRRRRRERTEWRCRCGPRVPPGWRRRRDGEDKVVLNWTALRMLYEEPVDYYEVEASEDGEYWKTLAPSVAETSYTHEGLEAGETHHYRVYAHSEEGRSLASAVACGSTDGALGKPCIPASGGGRDRRDRQLGQRQWSRGAPDPVGEPGGFLVREEYYIEDLPADAQTYTYTDVAAAEYMTLVLAYPGSADDLSGFTLRPWRRSWWNDGGHAGHYDALRMSIAAMYLLPSRQSLTGTTTAAEQRDLPQKGWFPCGGVRPVLPPHQTAGHPENS